MSTVSEGQGPGENGTRDRARVRVVQDVHLVQHCYIGRGTWRPDLMNTMCKGSHGVRQDISTYQLHPT